MRRLLVSTLLTLAFTGCVDLDDPAADSTAEAVLGAQFEPHPFDIDPFVVAVPGALDLDQDGYDSQADCADLDATIHPYTKERPNGIDDNCDGVVDEPMLSYDAARPSETQTYAQLTALRLRISDADTVAYVGNHTSIKYTLTYQRLSAGSSPDVTTPQESLTLAGNWLSMINRITGEVTHTLTLDPNSPTRGLSARTPYRMYVQLYKNNGVALGPPSPWFFVVTGGSTASPSSQLQLERLDMALVALDQYGDSEDGLVGKGGTLAPDGQRYTASNLSPLHPSFHPHDDLGWCDWFVHYVGAVVSDDNDGVTAANVVVDGGTAFWHAMNPNNVPNAFRDPDGDGCGDEIGDADGDGIANEHLTAGCQDLSPGTVTLDADDNQFFSNNPSNAYYDAVKSRPDNQGLGNYLGIAHHAALFLTFDPSGDGTFDGAGTAGTVWSVEGNFGDHVRVWHRAGDNTSITGFGKLTLAMFR